MTKEILMLILEKYQSVKMCGILWTLSWWFPTIRETGGWNYTLVQWFFYTLLLSADERMQWTDSTVCEPVPLSPYLSVPYSSTVVWKPLKTRIWASSLHIVTCFCFMKQRKRLVFNDPLQSFYLYTYETHPKNVVLRYDLILIWFLHKKLYINKEN